MRPSLWEVPAVSLVAVWWVSHLLNFIVVTLCLRWSFSTYRLSQMTELIFMSVFQSEPSHQRRFGNLHMASVQPLAGQLIEFRLDEGAILRGFFRGVEFIV